MTLELEVSQNAEALDKAYTKPELLAYAAKFGTDVPHNTTKKDVAALLAGDGINLELIAGQEQEEEDYDPLELGLQPLAPGEELETPAAEAASDDEGLVLVKMIRLNRTYEIRGYVFKTTHPFALVKESDADYLIEVDGGFQMASPREAREYYS